MTRRTFSLQALVDFPDDALIAKEPITEKQVDSMMAALRGLGVTEVSWGYYGDGHGGHRILRVGEPDWNYRMISETYRALGNPLRVAVQAAHRHGLKIYAYYKPYETGLFTLPEGSPEARAHGLLPHLGARLAWMDPFVVRNPNLRIRRRMDDLPAGIENIPIHAIRLVKRDDAPTRITREHLQIWTSPNNYRYRRMDLRFDVRETVMPSDREVRDAQGGRVTAKGAPVRVLTLSGFTLTDRCILVTTDFQDGPGDFENAGTDLLVALDAGGREIKGVSATGASIYSGRQIDFRNWGLDFDYGWGRGRTCLDRPNASGQQGFIAYLRGRNEYLTGALCETEPAVRDYWLECVREMLDAGVDGVEFREENHSTMTDYPEEYGFNPCVLAECARRGGADLLATMARVRGDAFTEFLRQARKIIAGRGKTMRYNLNVDYFRPDPPPDRRLAYPMHLDFQWRRWLDEGLLDAAVLRFYTSPFNCIVEDPIAGEMIAQCRQRRIPVIVNRYINQGDLEAEFKRVRDDGRFAGLVLYETYDFIRFHANGGCSVEHDRVKAVAREMAHRM